MKNQAIRDQWRHLQQLTEPYSLQSSRRIPEAVLAGAIFRKKQFWRWRVNPEVVELGFREEVQGGDRHVGVRRAGVGW